MQTNPGFIDQISRKSFADINANKSYIFVKERIPYLRGALVSPAFMYNHLHTCAE